MDKIHNLIKIRLWGSLKDQVPIVYVLLAFVPMSLQSMWTNKRQKRFGELPQVTQDTSYQPNAPSAWQYCFREPPLLLIYKITVNVLWFLCLTMGQMSKEY